MKSQKLKLLKFQLRKDLQVPVKMKKVSTLELVIQELVKTNYNNGKACFAIIVL